MPTQNSSPDDDDSSLQHARDARIALLEERMAKRSGVGVKLPLALLAMGFASYFLWRGRLDAAYVFASRTPTTLGAEGSYDFSKLATNTYVQVHGVPGERGVYSPSPGETRVGVVLQDTPIVVWRKTLSTEVWRPGRLPPRPDARPLALRGRLLAQGDAKDLKQLFEQLGPRDNLRPYEGALYVLREGERPGADWTPVVIGVALVGFLALNAVLLIRELGHRLRRREVNPEDEDDAG